MSGGTVCVLALNGRRQTVKCTPNTTILQILEEVCRKQDLKPVEYDLKHHNKVLDTTTTFRFSGLPNNAQLELVPATRLRSETDVILAVNLENGKRLMGNFSPNSTLLDVLNTLCPECLHANASPVVIYTRREIYGKELENVTLRSLGLTGGRAMIRVLNRAPEELRTQANVSAVIPSKPVEDKPYIRKFQSLDESASSLPQPAVKEEPQTNTIEDNKNADTNVPKPLQKNENVDLVKLAREKRKSKEVQSPQLGDRKKNISENQINSSKPAKRVTLCCCKNPDTDSDYSCPSGCKGTCKDTDDIEIKDDFIFLGERNAMLFSQETAEAIPQEDLPDDFYDLTIDDARKLLRDVKKQRHVVENGPLLTSNLRNLEDSKKQLRMLNRYKKAIIRVQFPDRVVLQGTFNPSDTVKDIVDFVRQYLEDKSLKFYVYSTPPKCILDESKILLEIGFVPGAVIHFGTDHSERRTSYLRKDLQNKFTSNSVASLAAAQIRRQNTRKCTGTDNDDCDFDYTEDPNRGVTVVNDGASTSTGISHDPTERKVPQYPPPENLPKWFKPM